ncbi:MAG: cation:dicarboxylase symporter family transporter [Planctomycetes bacterium]|nr:cation:dicarboxylase symporter family transporter [Planctomycetota bacterium]
MSSHFYHDFLMASDIRTILFCVVLAILMAIVWILQRRKVSFATRVLTATGMGLVLGLAIQYAAGFPAEPMQDVFVVETAKWYGLVGNGFIALIRMLVIPLIMVSIVRVIINMQGANLGRMTKLTLIVTMVMVVIAVGIGLGFGMAFNLGSGFSGAATETTTAIKDVQPVADTLLGLLPANPALAMEETNIIALVIFAAFFGAAARRMGQRHPEVVKPFTDLVNALHTIITSVAMYVIKLMPYAVIAMLANTIAQRGVRGIQEVALFIGVLYLGLAVMFVIQMVALSLFGISPLPFLRKALEPMIMAFTSRSSVGTLPLTIATLTGRMGVSEGTANFVASFNTTAGMQGCAGVFPAMLVVFVANLGGTPIDAAFLVMSTVVIAIGSFGIAGIPGTATMAASVALSGTGMASAFPLISPILAIDPIIDMGRSCLNVTGSMVNSLIVDKRLGLLDQARYRDPEATVAAGDAAQVEGM